MEDDNETVLISRRSGSLWVEVESPFRSFQEIVDDEDDGGYSPPPDDLDRDEEDYQVYPLNPSSDDEEEEEEEEDSYEVEPNSLQFESSDMAEDTDAEDAEGDDDDYAPPSDAVAAAQDPPPAIPVARNLTLPELHAQHYRHFRSFYTQDGQSYGVPWAGGPHVLLSVDEEDPEPDDDDDEGFPPNPDQQNANYHVYPLGSPPRANAAAAQQLDDDDVEDDDVEEEEEERQQPPDPADQHVHTDRSMPWVRGRYSNMYSTIFTQLANNGDTLIFGRNQGGRTRAVLLARNSYGQSLNRSQDDTDYDDEDDDYEEETLG